MSKNMWQIPNSSKQRLTLRKHWYHDYHFNLTDLNHSGKCLTAVDKIYQQIQSNNIKKCEKIKTTILNMLMHSPLLE